MHFIKHRPRQWLLAATVTSAFMLAIGSGIALAGNFQTWYCGSPSSPCNLGSGSPVSTASTALRDNNTVSCNTGCHTHVWYDAGSGAYDITHTNGSSSVSINQGSGGYAYSKCETDSGYGTNWATCETTWHT